MLDIRVVRESQKIFEKDLKKRNQAEKIPWLESLVEKDKEYRKILQETEVLRAKKNKAVLEIQELKGKKNPVEQKIEEAKKIPLKLKELDEKLAILKQECENYLMRLPNLLHESVPIGKDESDNVVVRTGGKKPKSSFEIMHHGEFAKKLGGADFERAAKISGAGFFFLKGDLARFELALARLAIDLLAKKGYALVFPPILMKRKPYESVTELEQFKDVIYKAEGEDLYLIATSEHPMAAMFGDEILEEKELPIKLCGYSVCFRKEVGKRGLDERGFFRVHQFNKVEQFVFCSQEQSWKFLEEMVGNAEELLKKLGLHYQVVNVCTGDIGAVAAKKYDINTWSPREEKFIETMSVSNCTDYQSIGLGIKVRKKGGEKEFVHTLNGTMVATSRLLRVLLETFQEKNRGLKVPVALQKYMDGKKEIKENRQ
ncbi:MAG: serine--tRNA ligase [Candidatus Diapherotrites archaeon]|nr:serine--tRNA ligase [Candidatus Diapherotrites archaeon]